jgi:hypothetical protein
MQMRNGLDPVFGLLLQLGLAILINPGLGSDPSPDCKTSTIPQFKNIIIALDKQGLLDLRTTPK